MGGSTRRLACQNRDGVSRGRVLRGIAGRRFTFLRLAIKLQKKNAAVRSSFFLSSGSGSGGGSTRKKSNVVGAPLSLSPPAIPSRPTIIRPLNCARDNNSTSKGAIAAAASAHREYDYFSKPLLWEGNETAQRRCPSLLSLRRWPVGRTN